MANIRNFLEINELEINEYVHNDNYWLNNAPQYDKPTCSDLNDSCIEAIIGAIYLSIYFDYVKNESLKIF